MVIENQQPGFALILKETSPWAEVVFIRLDESFFFFLINYDNITGLSCLDILILMLKTYKCLKCSLF